MTTQEQVRVCTPLPYKAVYTLWYNCHAYVCVGEGKRDRGGRGGSVVTRLLLKGTEPFIRAYNI